VSIPTRCFRLSPFCPNSYKHFGILPSYQIQQRRKSNCQFRDVWRCGFANQAESLFPAESVAPSINYRTAGIFGRSTKNILGFKIRSTRQHFFQVAFLTEIRKFFFWVLKNVFFFVARVLHSSLYTGPCIFSTI